MSKKVNNVEVSKVCTMFANGHEILSISNELSIPYCRVAKWISKYYLGTPLSEHSVILVKQSKV